MKTFEVICITIGLIPLPVTVVAALLGDESAPVSAGLTFAAFALSYLAPVAWKLRKQGVPFWCSNRSEAMGLWLPHKFADIGDPYEDPRILECSACGVHRQVLKKSNDTDTGHVE